MAIETVQPDQIEKKSFAIIGRELEEAGIRLDERYAHIIKRCIHTTADFDYARSLYFSPDAVERIEEAIERGALFITDTMMARAGINKKYIERQGGSVYCFIRDEDVAEEARKTGLTRSAVSMKKAASLGREAVFVIGNAPTALDMICRLHGEGKLNPVAVIGLPVGFVNVVEAKEELMASRIPCIVNRGRKGGSNVASCIINAIQYKMYRP